MAWCNKVCQISRIEPVPNSDRIEVAFIGEWPCVVQKQKYHAGDIIVYVMQDSILPDAMIAEMGLTGKLAGPAKNRVKAVKLRGQHSVGLVYPARPDWPIGYDATEDLGIVKYDPPVPIEMAGDCRALPPDWRKYDVDHWNSNPTAFNEGESVVMTEKIHGCLHKTTPITMADDSIKEIGDIRTGDVVKSFNLNTRQFENKRVMRHINSGKSEGVAWMKLTFDNGKSVIITTNHLVLTNKGWIEAGLLTGDHEIVHY